MRGSISRTTRIIRTSTPDNTTAARSLHSQNGTGEGLVRKIQSQPSPPASRPLLSSVRRDESHTRNMDTSTSHGHGNQQVQEGNPSSNRGNHISSHGRGQTRGRGGGHSRGSNSANSTGASSSRPPQRGRLTHFLCLPLVNPASEPQLVASMAQFHKDLAAYNASSTVANTVPNSGVRHVGSLHLTLGVMSLESAEKLEQAIALLRELDYSAMLLDAARDGESGLKSASSEDADGEKNHQKPEPLVISLKGLLPMHKPKDTSVLYAKPEDDSHRLYNFCKSLQQKFIAAGLVSDEARGLKLHATIINTLYAKSELRTVKRIDSTVLAAQYADFEWMKAVRLGRIAICKMGAKKTFDANRKVIAEAYEEIAVAYLPK